MVVTPFEPQGHAAHKRQVHGSIFYSVGLLLKFYIAAIRNFVFFCCCDLELDPMAFIYMKMTHIS